MADEYGPIFTVRVGLFPAVVVNSFEVAKECWTKHDLGLSSRPQLLATEVMGYNHAFLSFAPYGQYWREMRKTATVELLSKRRINLLVNPIVASAIDTAIKEMHKLWNEKKNNSGYILIDLKQWFASLSLNIFLKLVASKGYYSGAATVDEEEVRQCDHALNGFFHFLGVLPVADALPFLRWLDLGGHEKTMRSIAEELDAILSGWLEEHKRNSKSPSKNKGDRDFMDAMLSTVDGEEMGGFNADTIIKATSLTMVSAGTVTIRATVTWAVSLLVNNLHILKKTQEELDAQIGEQRHVNESDIANLSYLHAVVKETLRLHPPIPLAAQHESTEDCIIDGHYVPKGTRVTFNLSKIQTDERAWPEPMEFKPERFSSSRKDLKLQDHNFEYSAFGGGRRMCPGMSFGVQMVHSILARFLHAFEVSTPGNLPVDMSEGLGLTVEKATPLEVLLAPRLPKEAYGFV